MKSIRPVALSLIWIMSVCMTDSGRCGEVFQKDALPTGGKFVSNRTDKFKNYYFINEDRMRTESNAQKQCDLYQSAYEGKTWELVCALFDFNQLSSIQ
jgi:hypothetical protein